MERSGMSKKLQEKELVIELVKTSKMVAVNDTGRRIGEDHPKANLSDHEVELMRKLYELYPIDHPDHFGYRRLAAKFGCTKTAARKICKYTIRVQLASSHKRVT